MIEFAIVLPLLVLLLFGIVEFSLVYNRQQALHAAAREGARVASVETSTLTDISTTVDNALSGTAFGSSPNTSVTPNVTQPCLNRVGETVAVIVSATTPLDIPLWNNINVALTGEARFRCE